MSMSDRCAAPSSKHIVQEKASLLRNGDLDPGMPFADGAASTVASGLSARAFIWFLMSPSDAVYPGQQRAQGSSLPNLPSFSSIVFVGHTRGPSGSIQWNSTCSGSPIISAQALAKPSHHAVFSSKQIANTSHFLNPKLCRDILVPGSNAPGWVPVSLIIHARITDFILKLGLRRPGPPPIGTGRTAPSLAIFSFFSNRCISTLVTEYHMSISVPVPLSRRLGHCRTFGKLLLEADCSLYPPPSACHLDPEIREIFCKACFYRHSLSNDGTLPVSCITPSAALRFSACVRGSIAPHQGPVALDVAIGLVGTSSSHSPFILSYVSKDPPHRLNQSAGFANIPSSATPRRSVLQGLPTHPPTRGIPRTWDFIDTAQPSSAPIHTQ
ncbi:hypothetical protein P152DRAFT_510870, partial [Eremomyces bilateralis CBS 781.70]